MTDIAERTKQIVTESRLQACYPHLVPTDEEICAAAHRIEAAYLDYIKHVSPAIMAISQQTAAFTLCLAERLKVRSAVDFGSGFISYVLRLVCDDVWSVDDSPEWLAWTRRFLERREQSIDHLCLWGDFTERHYEPFDLAVYDFSGGDKRLAHFTFALRQVRPGGVAILDDAQQQPSQEAMHKAARECRCDLFGLRDWTLDQFNRYAALAVIA